jgi:hypothetical protein
MKRRSPPLNHLNEPQCEDLAFALALTDELTPLPSKAHTALLILRDRLADAMGVSVAELMDAHAAASTNTTKNWPHHLTGSPKS